MLRKATVEDVPMLCEARRRQLVDEGLDPVIDIDEELRRYFEGALADGTIVEWVLEEEGELVATAALCLMPFLPSYNNPVGTRGYVTNMYTVPSHRGRGIATRMLAVLMDEARGLGLHKVVLQASEMGGPVYERYGFRPSGGWMELDL